MEGRGEGERGNKERKYCELFMLTFSAYSSARLRSMFEEEEENMK